MRASLYAMRVRVMCVSMTCEKNSVDTRDGVQLYAHTLYALHIL